MSANASEFHQALEYVADRSRLLEGENPDSQYLEDAILWQSVYEELTTFKLALIQTTREQAAKVSPQGEPEVRNDLAMAQAELGRLQDRLGWWQRRRAELEGGDRS